jgi:hypothetical protein
VNDTEAATRRLFADAVRDRPAEIDLLLDFRRRWKVRRVLRRAALVATAAVVLVAVATIALSVPRPPSALAAVTTAAARTATQSYQVRAVYSQPEPPGTSARFDRLIGKFSPSGAVGEVNGQQFRIVGGYEFLQLGRNRHEPWFRFPAPPPTGAGAKLAALLGPTAPREVASSAGLLALLLKSAGHVRQTGSTSGPGWTGTRYAFTATRAFPPVLNLKIAGTISVDQQGRVRQLDDVITTILVHPPAGVSRTKVQAVKATFGDFGVPVSVTAPPAN